MILDPLNNSSLSSFSCGSHSSVFNFLQKRCVFQCLDFSFQRRISGKTFNNLALFTLSAKTALIRSRYGSTSSVQVGKTDLCKWRWAILKMHLSAIPLELCFRIGIALKYRCDVMLRSGIADTGTGDFQKLQALKLKNSFKKVEKFFQLKNSFKNSFNYKPRLSTPNLAFYNFHVGRLHYSSRYWTGYYLHLLGILSS